MVRILKEVDPDFFDACDDNGKEIKQVTCGFTVQVDTREQAPYRFTGITEGDASIVVPLKTDLALTSGDYSIVGLHDRVAVERKSHSDLLGSITHGRERFEREFVRLNQMDFAAVVVEADWQAMLIDNRHISRVTPTTITRTIFSWSIEYPRVHWFTCMNRRHGELTTFRLLEMFWRKWQHKQQALEEIASVNL